VKVRIAYINHVIADVPDDLSDMIIEAYYETLEN